jgi:hypothetical protein
MKHILSALLALALAAPALRGQTTAFNDFIERHRSDPAMTYAFLSKEQMEVVSKTKIDNADWQKARQIVQNVGSLRVLASDSTTEGVALYREATGLVPADFDELLSVRDGSDNVRIWVRNDQDLLTDVVLLVGAPTDFVLVCFAGQIDLANLTELARLFDAEQVEALVRTSAALSVDFAVSPNPSNGSFTLTYADGDDVAERVRVLDQTGREVALRTLSGGTSERIQLDVPNGLYWLQITTRQGKIGTQQVQVQK